jgi:hypothetical protein
VEPYTEDEIVRIDQALTATHGNRAQAAVVLGVDVGRVYHAVERIDAIRAKWSPNFTVPEEKVGEIDRIVTDPMDEKLATAFNKQDKLLSKGVEATDLAGDRKEFLLSIQQNYGKHWKSLTDLFRGGIVYTSSELLFQFNNLTKVLADLDANPSKFDRINEKGVITKSSHEYRLEYIDRALHIAEMFRKLNSDRENAELVAAKVEKMKVEKAKKVTRKVAAWEQDTTDTE